MTTAPEATLPPAGSEKHLFLVDLSGYVFRAYHAIAPLSSSKGEPTHAVMGTVNMLQKVVTVRRPHMFAVAMDSRGKTFRHELDERYKANRPEPPPDLAQQMARCEQIVRAYNVPVYQLNGIEADDLIASVTRQALVRGLDVVIVSSDKDLMQLVRDEDARVVLWDTMRDKVYGPREVEEKWGVPPSRLHDLLALVGDTSDNVPGVPGVGPKTAADLLKSFGTLDGVYAGIDSIAKPKLRESLKTHEADARLSYQLVALRGDVDVAWDDKQLVYGEPNEEELERLFTELEFTRMLQREAKPKPQRPRELGTITTAEGLASVASKARERGALALALELAGSDPMTADVIGVSLSAAPGEASYVPLSHRYLGAPKQLTWGDVKVALASVLADTKVKKLGHDVKLAEIVLARNGLVLAPPTFDVMLAAYLVDSEASSALGDLAQRLLGAALPVFGARPAGSKAKGPAPLFDELEVEEATKLAAPKAAAISELAAKLEPRLEIDGVASLMNDVEMPLSRVLAEVERIGVLVDTEELAVIGKRADAELARLEARARELAGRDFSVRSRDQLETILFDELELPVLKKTPKGGRSTDAQVLEELAERHELPRVINEYREIDKLKGTYIDALPRSVNNATGRIHTSYEQAVAATGRLSSRDPNLQNIPIRTELGREIRSAFVAPKGAVILSADYSQIELRLLAHLSGDPELLEAFKTGEDVHVRTASLVFDTPAKDVTKEMRGRAKTINFGVIYGMGEAALAKQIDVSRDEASRFIDAYFRRYQGVRRYMDGTLAEAQKTGAVRTLLGRRRVLPNLHSANRMLRSEAERIAKNTPIQGTAADLMKLAMVRLGAHPVSPDVKMILTVHDELVFEVPEGRVKEVGEAIRDGMSGAMKLDVPLVVDVGSGPNWSAAH